MREAVRVALLARPGPAADRLRESLGEAGAQLVLDVDPTGLEPEALAAAGAEAVVVVLDAAMEDALDRLDVVLHDPAIDVLYEESEIAAAREGWDAARWSRHLVAKLMRHDDVLPPGREADVAREPVAARVPQAPAPVEAPAASMFDPVAAEYDAAGDTQPVETTSIEIAPEPEPELEPELAPSAELEAGADTDAPPDPAAPLVLSLADDATPSAPAAPTDVAGRAGPGIDAIRDFRRDLGDIEQRIASMELVDASPPAPASSHAGGAVLVLAGIGGPDAVRQFLGELPEDFPRPVLVQQRLDGGRHDRLVQQMSRATRLPVRLAADGDLALAGHVYILPPDLGLSGGEGGLRFVAGGNPITTLPSADSAVLMFSGSDKALVDAAMDHAQAGALVAGQSPEDCYDAAAADALLERGVQSGQPAELARRLAERWAA